MNMKNGLFALSDTMGSLYDAANIGGETINPKKVLDVSKKIKQQGTLELYKAAAYVRETPEYKSLSLGSTAGASVRNLRMRQKVFCVFVMAAFAGALVVLGTIFG